MNPSSALPLRTFAALAAFAVSRIAFSAEAEPATATAPEPLQATADTVFETRSTMNVSSRLMVSIRASDLAGAAGLARLNVTKAVDDLGNELRAVPERISMMRAVHDVWGAPMRGSLVFSNVPRRASEITLIEGSADLLFPTAENGGLVTIDAPLQHAGVPLEQPALAEHGIAVTIVSDERASELRRPPRVTPADEARRLSDVANEVSRRRAEREAAARALPSPSEEGRTKAVQEEVARRRASRAEVTTTEASDSAKAAPIPPSSAVARITDSGTRPTLVSGLAAAFHINVEVADPQSKLVGLEWRLVTGEPVVPLRQSVFGNLRLFEFRETVPQDVVLVAYIATDAAIRSRPFRIGNVKLP